MSSNLPYLVCQRFPKLKSLVLAHSGLYNLHCLGQANAQGRFPSLQYLDVSKNFCSSDSLFRFETDWKQLEVVHVGVDHGWALSCQSIASMIEKKHLKRLKQLHVWFKEDTLLEAKRCPKCWSSYPELVLKRRWERELCRKVKEHEQRLLSLKPNPPFMSHKQVLDPVVTNLDKLMSSSCLQAVYFYSDPMYPTEAEAEKRQIRGRVLELHFVETYL